MPLDLGTDKPDWWDGALAELRRGAQVQEVKDSLVERGVGEYDLKYLWKNFPERKREWDDARDAGRYRDINELFELIEFHLRLGATPVQAAISSGMPRRRWYYINRTREDVKKHFEELQQILPPPSEERYAVNWLLHGLEQEKQATSDGVALVAMGSLKEILLAAGDPDATLESVREAVIREAGLMLVHREDMPELVRQLVGPEDEE